MTKELQNEELQLNKTLIVVFSKGDSLDQFMNTIFSNNAKYLSEKAINHRHKGGTLTGKTREEVDELMEFFLHDPTMVGKELVVFSTPVSSLDDVQHLFDYFGGLEQHFEGLKFAFNYLEWTEEEKKFIGSIATKNNFTGDAMRYLMQNFSVNDLNTFSLLLNQMNQLSMAVSYSFDQGEIPDSVKKKAETLYGTAFDYLQKNLEVINK